MEPRFGFDFSRVRVHAGPTAASAAAALYARAFTIGRDVYFGANQYAPETAAGQRLLAHELAHVVQQNGHADATAPQASLAVSMPGDAAEREADSAAEIVMQGGAPPRMQAATAGVQRTCGPALGAPIPDCTPSQEGSAGWQFQFIVNCNDFKPGEETRLIAFARGLRTGSTLRVHGFASEEGPAAFNLSLSCHRANAAANVLRSERPDCTVSAVLKHGAQSDPNPRDFWRSVIVEEIRPQSQPENVCGPDATQWFVDQVAKAKTDPVVLAIQAQLAGAHRVAAANGFSAEQVAAGGVAKKVLAEEARVGSPPRTGAADPQLKSSVSSQAAFGRALLAAPVPIAGAPEALVLAAIRGAALTWKGLVGTGKKYDFKNDSRTMKNPTSANCPRNCRGGTITFCPTPMGACFGTDLPGNLFYAHVGRWVGWTELTLQLGSQFAQLDSTATWDPPEDTAMISLGFALPDPLTRAAVCATMGTLRNLITLHACANCSEPTSAQLV